MGDNTVDGVVNRRQFESLLRLNIATGKKVASEQATYRERIAKAVENGNLHAGAFSLMAKLTKMTEEKRDDFLRALDIMREYAEAEGGAWADGHTGDMFEKKGKEADEDEGDEPSAEELAAKHAEENAKRLEKGIKPLEGDQPAPASNVTPLKTVGMPGAEGTVKH